MAVRNLHVWPVLYTTFGDIHTNLGVRLLQSSYLSSFSRRRHKQHNSAAARTLSGLTAPAALEGEQVGVVTIAPQAQVGPPDVVTAMRVEDELGIGQLHHT